MTVYERVEIKYWMSNPTEWNASCCLQIVYLLYQPTHRLRWDSLLFCRSQL